MGREDDTSASSGDWKYDGDKKLYKRIVRKITMRLQKEGGPSLAKHWDGAMSYMKVLQTITEWAPYLEAVDEDDATEEDANWTSKDDIPKPWREFCETYVPGRVDVGNPLHTKSLKLHHYQRAFVKELARSRDLAVYNFALEHARGKAALVLKQIPEGAGSKVQAIWYAEFGKVDKMEVRKMKSAFTDGDPYRKGSAALGLNDSVDVEQWFRAYEDLRVEVAEEMEDLHAANGFDTETWGSILSYENMLETVLTVFNAHTNAYEVIMDSIQSAEGYEEVRDRLKEKYRILQSKKEATKIVDKQKAAATKARKLKIAQITMEDDNICRKCGGEGHWANDPTCPKFFQNWPRAGKDGGGKGKGQGKGKGGGKGAGKDGGGKGKGKDGGGKGKGGGWGGYQSPDKCFQFEKHGNCHYGMNKRKRRGAKCKLCTTWRGA